MVSEENRTEFFGRAVDMDLSQREAHDGTGRGGACVPRAGGARWYALAVRTRWEKSAAVDLERRGIEVFLPVRCERRIWSDRVKTVESALFPGYIFVRSALSGQEKYRILDAGNIVGRSGSTPGIAIAESEIASVRKLAARAKMVVSCPAITSGCRVVVIRGPLRGVEGEVEMHGGRHTIVCAIDLLGRAVRAEIDADVIVPLNAL